MSGRIVAPGRRAFLRGGLAAIAAAALSSCGLVQGPAFAADKILPWELLVVLQARLTEAGRAIRSEGGTQLTISAATKIIGVWETENGLYLGSAFANGTIYLGIKSVGDEDGSRSLFIVWQNPRLIEGMTFDQFITRDPPAADKGKGV